MGLGKNGGSKLRREKGRIGLRWVQSKSFGRKRVVLLNDKPTPPSEEHCCDGNSLLESLPQEILVMIFCWVEHDDLESLFVVSKTIKEAALIAKKWHFEYNTPRKTLSFSNPFEFNDIEPPNAPKRITRSRLDSTNLSDISVELFASPNDDNDESWQNPPLRSATLESIQSVVTFLQSKGIHQKDLGRIFGMCPKILTADIKSELIPVCNFLRFDLKVPEQDFRKVINKCPRLLASSVRDQLKPALFYLRRLGFRNLTALAYQDPILLVSSVEKTLIPKLDYLVTLGFSKDEVIAMVLRCPGLLTFSVENNFKPKFQYFTEEMKGKLEELKEFPQFFTFSLEKRIKLRHMEIVERRVEVPLPLLLKSSDEEFKELLKQGR